MTNIFKKFADTVIGDKKAWRQMEARAKALPEEYNYVYHKIQGYMWNFTAGSGMDMIAIFADLLELFEEGAANGQNVLEVTGQDVAAFSDELLRNAKTSTENRRKALNRDILQKVGNGEDAQ